MLLEELISLNDWFNAKETQYEISSKLNTLLGQLQNANNPNQMVSFTNEKNNAIEALKEYKFSELSRDQIECLKVYDGFNYMGPDAAEDIATFFREEGYDLAFLLEQVQKTVTAIQNTRKQLAAAAKAVTPFSDAVTRNDYLTEKSRFSIIFKGNVSVDNLKDLEDRSKEWSEIMHSIGRALHLPSEEFKVLGARNGSFIIDLYLVAAAMPAVALILYTSFDVIERFAVNLKRLNTIFQNNIDDPDFQEVTKDITNASERYFNLKKLKAAEEIAEQVLDETNCPDESRHESRAFLQSAVKRILNHLRKGGDLDAYSPQASSEEGEEADEPVSLLEQRRALAKASEIIQKAREKKLELPDDITTLLEHLDFEEGNDREDEDLGDNE